MPRRLTIPVCAAAIALLLAPNVQAQESTPVQGEAAASICQEVEPRTADFFSRLDATPAAEQEQTESQGTPAAGTDALASIAGERVDEATMQAIADHYGHLMACINDGDYLRAYALYSDDYLVRNLSAETIEQLEATPVPVEESTRSAFRQVIDARRQDDGRLAALVAVTNPQSGDIIIRAILVQNGDGLLIDDESVVEAVDRGTPAAAADATPSG